MCTLTILYSSSLSLFTSPLCLYIRVHILIVYAYLVPSSPGSVGERGRRRRQQHIMIILAVTIKLGGVLYLRPDVLLGRVNPCLDVRVYRKSVLRLVMWVRTRS